MREIVIDTETTGIGEGHRVVSVGAVELWNRLPTGRQFHELVNPERKVDPGAFRVHGLSDELLAKKPKFKIIAPKLVKFIGTAPLVAHNASFDQGMLNREFGLLNVQLQNEWIDTLPLARKAKPGGKHTLDALLKHYGITGVNRDLHGALLDSQLLAEVYLHLRGGRQAALDLAAEIVDEVKVEDERPYYPPGTFNKPRITPEEIAAHAAFIAEIKNAVWDDYLTAKQGEPPLPIAA